MSEGPDDPNAIAWRFIHNVDYYDVVGKCLRIEFSVEEPLDRIELDPGERREKLYQDGDLGGWIVRQPGSDILDEVRVTIEGHAEFYVSHPDEDAYYCARMNLGGDTYKTSVVELIDRD